MSFETSPLQRVLKTGGIGDGFQINQHYKTLSYRNNTTGLHGDNVQKWVLGSSNASSTTTYADNELTVTEVVDENNVHASVYKDKFGRLILKRQDAPSSGYYDTYYVYDNIGNIVYIVPPKAIAKMGGTYNTSSTPELIYQFWYDYKNRIVQKKVPGAKEVYMVYDPLDRVVLTQDGAMRFNNGTKWAYIKYDNANRVIIQGIYDHGSVVSQDYMQNTVVKDQSCYQTSSATYYEIRQSGSSGYSNQCFPTSGTEERGYNYYDNYDFDFDGNADYTKQDQGLTNEATATGLTYGLATGSKTKILGTSTWLVQVSFYDQYYHVIQVRSNNQIKTNVTDHTTNVVNFAGQAVEAKQVKTIGDPNGITNTLEITVSTRYEYDDMGRLTKVKQTNPGAAELTVANYEYNPLGQLVDKKLHSTNGTNYLQSVDMRYNIRGQLTSINNSTLTNDGVINDESNDVFGMEILYEKEETGSDKINNTGNFAGMISAVKWKAASPANTTERSYKYSYDNLYRLTLAQYQEKSSTSGLWNRNVDGFNESLSYDENGNIKTLLRNSVISSTVTTIDDLTYSYKNSDKDNQLENISDAVTTNATGYGYRNFTNTNSTTPYDYDDNGNLKTDLKKGTTFTYNELNKPTLIQISSTKKVEYRYDAAGNRISKYVYNNSSTPTKSIEYIGGYVIENDILSYYSMAEGRVRNEGGGFGLVLKMEYFITDQQGNTRVSFEDNNGTVALIQENSYYVFGMQMAGAYLPSNQNKRLYNAGSEWQDDIEGLADYYSTFFREYDPVIGRFNGVDPMAEATDAITTYAYANNNPVMMNDPLGDYAGAPPYVPKWGERSWEVMERIMGNYGFGDWTFDEGSSGGGAGTYAALKAHLDYIGSPEWKKEMNSKAESNFFSNLIANGTNNKAGYYWFANGEGQYSETPNITVYGSITNGQWNTNRVEFDGNRWYEGYDAQRGGHNIGGIGAELMLPGGGRGSNSLAKLFDWNGPIWRTLIKDKYTISINLGAVNYFGPGGTSPLSFTILTRGGEGVPGVYFAPSVNALTVANGQSVFALLSVQGGYFTGDTRKIVSSDIGGFTYQGDISLNTKRGIIVSINGSYSNGVNGKYLMGGFSAGLGFIAPHSARVAASVNYTPQNQVIKLFGW
jgi:RHS repeat-associated protein